MSPPLPMIGGGQPVADAVALLTDAGAAVVLIDGKPGGVIGRQDLLAYLEAGGRQAPAS
jgi:cystathionine beta-synthase